MQRSGSSAGQLHIGAVIYEHGIFSVEMTFVVNGLTIGEDAAKSAAQAATRHFYELMHGNGYHSHGMPNVKVRRRELRSILFYIEALADRAKPQVITIRETVEEPKTNGDGRGEVGDQT